jgi:uracil phosphoribosyltransferase
MACDHPTLRVLDHPLIQHKLSRLRDSKTSSEDFRRLLNQVAGLMTFQVSRDLATADHDVATPLATARCRKLATPVTLVPILRAGLGMVDGILLLFPEARVGHIGLYRDETTHQPVAYYAKFPPDMAAGPALVVDPMLATGGSAVEAINTIKDAGCKDVRLICLVAAPEGVDAVAQAHGDVPIFTASLDDHLNENKYIVPGLGDAGDRIFGTA